MPERSSETTLDPSGESISLVELAETWCGSGRDASPEVAIKLGEIGKQWHAYVRQRIESGDGLTSRSVSAGEVGNGTIALPEPIVYGRDPETDEPLQAYPMLGVSYYPSELEGDDTDLQWWITFHQFKAHAERQNQALQEAVPHIVETLGYHRETRDILSAVEQTAVDDLTAYVTEHALKTESIFDYRPDDKTHQRLLLRFAKTQRLEGKLVQAAGCITGDYAKARSWCEDVRAGLASELEARG